MSRTYWWTMRFGLRNAERCQRKIEGTVYLDFGFPCGRVVISRPSDFVAVVAHASSPKRVSRLTLRRIANFGRCAGMPAIETAPPIGMSQRQPAHNA